jgi:predicted S18 family serine protease
MSFSEDYQNATNEATLALLENIKEAAKESSKLNPGNRAEALNNLAEAYARVTNPAQRH